MKKIRLDVSGEFFTGERKIVQASYVVAIEIAKQKKPHFIGEILIKSCVLKMADIMLGKDADRKLALISLSNSTLQTRIKDLSDDIKRQVVEEIKNALFGLFVIQIDESTDISSYSLLMVFTKYIYNDTFMEEFLFCLS